MAKTLKHCQIQFATTLALNLVAGRLAMKWQAIVCANHFGFTVSFDQSEALEPVWRMQMYPPTAVIVAPADTAQCKLCPAPAPINRHF